MNMARQLQLILATGKGQGQVCRIVFDNHIQAVDNREYIPLLREIQNAGGIVKTVKTIGNAGYVVHYALPRR